MSDDQSALLLTNEEWADLATICEVYRYTLRVPLPPYVHRRLDLVDRIVRAARA